MALVLQDMFDAKLDCSNHHLWLLGKWQRQIWLGNLQCCWVSTWLELTLMMGRLSNKLEVGVLLKKITQFCGYYAINSKNNLCVGSTYFWCGAPLEPHFWWKSFQSNRKTLLPDRCRHQSLPWWFWSMWGSRFLQPCCAEGFCPLWSRAKESSRQRQGCKSLCLIWDSVVGRVKTH